MEWARILASATRSLNQELRLRNEYLLAENRTMKAQLKGRLRLADAERATLGEIGHRLGRKGLSEVATAAQPDTILAWHRRLVAREFNRSFPRRSPGRPRIDGEVEALIVRMAEENRSWGYDRIVGALANLGHEVSDQTVGNVLRRNGIPPAPARKRTTTWAEFIRIHLAVLAGVDVSSVRLIIQELVGYCVMLFIHLEGHRTNIARTVKSLMRKIARIVAIQRSGDPWHCRNLLHDCGMENSASFLLNIRRDQVQMPASPTPSPQADSGAEGSKRSPKNASFSNVIPLGERSTRLISNGCTGRNRHARSTTLLFRQITEMRCEEAARCRERPVDPQCYDRHAA